MSFFKKLGKGLGLSRRADDDYDEDGEQAADYVELDTERGAGGNQKIIVRPFIIEDFSDVKPILEALREGNTICLVNIKPLREKDIVELKRAINKLKKTCDAMEGDIAGFSEDFVVIAPNFAEIYRSKGSTTDIKSEE
ncbi:MAG: cell division protein SepF [archaeon]